MLARADGFRAALRYEGDDVAGLLALVAAGQGLALLPARVVEARRRRSPRRAWSTARSCCAEVARRHSSG